MKQYAGFIALAALSMAAAGWMFASDLQEQNRSGVDNVPVAQARSSGGEERSRPKAFDFYVLALSWSPAFCASEAGKNSRQQCDSEKKYGFVVHGLWPQNEAGYPQFCGADRNERVADSVSRTMLDIMPSTGLIRHQWRKHGTCSGLSQQEYFDTTRKAYERIVIPAALSSPRQSERLSADAIEAAFTAENAGMKKEGIAVSCDGPRMEEVRICLNKDLSFRSCPEVDRKGCRSNVTEIIPIQ